jgi:Uma2 family endonuclease
MAMKGQMHAQRRVAVGDRRHRKPQLEATRDSEHLAGMSIALRIPPRMTVAEFLEWEPDDRSGALWQLRDGEPEMMAPASDRHGSIQARLAHLLIAHLDARGDQCRVVAAPGVVPSERAEDNCLVPDLGVTWSPPTGEHLMQEPLALVDVLSPTNVSRTRANVRAYRTIGTVQEIVVLHSTAIVAEILRRTRDGSWPQQPEIIGAESELRLDRIGFAAPLRDAYRTTNLAQADAARTAGHVERSAVDDLDQGAPPLGD